VNILITGCFGFIGFNFLNYISDNFSKEFKIIGIDALKFPTSKINSTKYTENENFEFYEIDINNIHETNIEDIDILINFAAESHVDNSITNPIGFIESNVKGLGNLLMWAFEKDIQNILHISTDEVYGSSDEDYPSENSKFNPSSPYSASKASAEHLCTSFAKTYGQNINILRPSNNYGIYQQPEKLIPFSIANLINDRNIEVYGSGKNIRHWLHVNDTSRAILKVMESTCENEVFNIGSGEYLENLFVVDKLLEILNLDSSRISFVEDRLGHDFRYAVNFDKLKQLGWEPKEKFDLQLEKIVTWYENNQDWWSDSYKEIVKNREIRNKLTK
jgi:dTDP-glucose 4,6-dehydratase